MKLLLDMTIPIAWEDFLKEEGWDVVHCSKLENRPVKDADVMHWARENSCVLFTHDLDFGAIIALVGESGPSVFQVTIKDIMVANIGSVIVSTIRQFQPLLEKGAVVVVDIETARAKVVELKGQKPL